MNKKTLMFLIIILVVINKFIFTEEIEKEQLEKIFNDYTLYPQVKLFGNLYFIQGEKEYSVGMFGGELSKLVSECPVAKEEMKKFKNDKIVGLTLYIVGFGIIFASPFLLNDSQQEIWLGIALGGCTISLVGAFKLVTSVNHVYNAVRYYNKYILFEKKDSDINFFNPQKIRIDLLKYSKKF